jgi:hypothetical protein
MKIYLRKYILWLYVFLITVITGAVLIIGCDGGGSSSGGSNNNHDTSLGTMSQYSTSSDSRSNQCNSWAFTYSCTSWYITGPSGGIYTCWGKNCD